MNVSLEFHDGPLRASSRLNDVGRHFRGEHSLGIIAQQQSVSPRNQLIDVRDQPVRHVTRQRMCLLGVDPQDLLAMGDDTCFAGSWPIVCEKQAVRLDVRFLEDSPQALTGMIAADHAVQPSSCSKCRDVGGRIGRPARPSGTISGLDNRHGRFGAKSADIAPEVLVQHDVADDEDLATGETSEQRFQINEYGDFFERPNH